MVNQFRFVRDHHKRIKRIAVVTDSHLGDVAEHLTSHFVKAEIRHFPAGQIEAARQWIMNGFEALTPGGHHRDGKINGIDVTGEVR